MGNISMTAADLDALTGGAEKKIQLDTTLAADYSAGQISYDATSKTALVDTGYTGVRVNVGQEIHIPFYNNTGGLIANGTAINAAGVEPTSNLFYGIKADASSPATSSAVIGLATADVADGAIGLATELGTVRDFDTSALSAGGLVYLSETAGLLTNTRPLYPSNIVIMGSVLVSDVAVGEFFSKPSTFVRLPGSRTYFFTSNGATAGTVFIAGSYDYDVASTTLTQAVTETHGAANNASGSHAFAVCGSVGTVVGGGTVALQVSGDSYSDDGTKVIGDTEIIIADIELVATDEYYESTKNWGGVVTYTLVITSGAPSAYSLPVNYGFAAYIDGSNRDFTLKDIRVEGLCKATEADLDVEIMAHRSTGWTYSAGSFVAGDGVLASFKTDMAPNNTITAGRPFKWKRSSINEFLDGGGSEGFIIRVTTTNNNAVQNMTTFIGGVLETLSA